MPPELSCGVPATTGGLLLVAVSASDQILGLLVASSSAEDELEFLAESMCLESKCLSLSMGDERIRAWMSGRLGEDELSVGVNSEEFGIRDGALVPPFSREWPASGGSFSRWCGRSW